MPFTNQWDVTQPPDTQLANLLGQDIRNLKLDIQQRLVLSGLNANKPPLNTDAQPANWTGLLFFATDTGHIWQWSGAAWVDITNSFIEPAVVTYFNALATTGVSIPAGSLEAGDIVEISMKITQTPGAGIAQLNSPIIGGLTTVIPANGGGSTIIWTVFARVFVSAVGVSGFSGGYYCSAQGTVNIPFTLQTLQASTVDTTSSNIPVSAQLTAGCTAGPITVKVL